MIQLFNERSNVFLVKPRNNWKFVACVIASCVLAAAAHPPLLKRHAAVSELRSIRDRLSRHEESLGAGWGLDWSRRISPALPKGSLSSQHHVSSASNSYGSAPSVSTSSLLYSRPRQRPAAVQRRVLQGYRQFLNPYVLPKKRPNHFSQYGRFENSPSSSTSNGDNLPEFAYHLNKVATHRRRVESMMPVETVYGTKSDESSFLTDNDASFETDDVGPNRGIENFGGVVEVTKEDGLDYPDVIVKSTLELTPNIAGDSSPIRGYLPLYGDTSNSIPELTELDESLNDVESDEEIPFFRNYRGEGIPYQQILLDNAIDLDKLTEKNDKENTIEQHQQEEEDTGKSFSNFVPTQARRVQLITDPSVSPVIEDNHKVIYLKMVQPESVPRLKGTKLKEVLESDNEDLLGESFESYLSSDARDTSKTREDSLSLSNPFGFDLIENQIAAVNRIGDVASSESNENTQIINDELINGGPRARLNEQDSLENATKTATSQIKANIERILDVKQKLKRFGDAEQRSNSPANQNKQLENYYPQPSSDVFDKDSSGSGTGYGQGVTATVGSNSNISPSRPYKQKYPGWANVEPYQYSQKDPETGAYKFGYGDQYQWRQEERRADGVVFGGYGWLDETGRQHIIRFVADRLGYRVLPQGQEIDFSEIPVYPPLKETEDSQSSGSPSQGYNTIDFVTPKPLGPADFGGYTGRPVSSTLAPDVPDFNIPQVHPPPFQPPVSYPGSILQLLGPSSGSQIRPLNTSAVSNNADSAGIAITFNENSESSTIPPSILESLLKDQANQSYQGRSQKEDLSLSEQGEGQSGTPKDSSDSENSGTLGQFASSIDILKQNNGSSERKPPLNTASNSIAIPISLRTSAEETTAQ